MTTHPTLNAKVERTIAASPERLYEMVSDVTQVGAMSPECTSAEWIGGSTGPEVGARFKGKNELGTTSWTTKPRVTAADPGHVFEFKVPMAFGPRWRYEFHPVAEGTRVVESVTQAKPSPWFIRRAQKKQGVTDRVADVTAGMHQTLENLEALASM